MVLDQSLVLLSSSAGGGALELLVRIFLSYLNQFWPAIRCLEVSPYIGVGGRVLSKSALGGLNIVTLYSTV